MRGLRHPARAGPLNRIIDIPDPREYLFLSGVLTRVVGRTPFSEFRVRGLLLLTYGKCPMRHLVLAALSVLVFVCPDLQSQPKRRLKFDFSVSNKVEVGMSAEKVKKALGRPDTTADGVPDAKEGMVQEMPAQNGQLNRSTWFYFYSEALVRFVKGNTEFYVVNGSFVSRAIYDWYSNKDLIYRRDGAILDSMYTQIYGSFHDGRLTSEPKNKKRSFKNDDRATDNTHTVIPIFCIIFDRGTQMVAETKTLFKASY